MDNKRCVRVVPGGTIPCGKKLVINHKVADGQAIELCESGHLMLFDPEIQGGQINIWRFHDKSPVKK